MQFISSRAHGVLDYLTGVLLIFAPRLLGFEDTGLAAQVPVMLGIATLVYSLLTRYELGLVRVLPFRAHLTIDLLSGIFLAASPWLLGFHHQVWVPHVVVGLFEIIVSVATHRETGVNTRPAVTPRGRGAGAL